MFAPSAVVFWDYENIPVSKHVNALSVVRHIKDQVLYACSAQLGEPCQTIAVSAYGNMRLVSDKIKMQLGQAAVTLVDIASTKGKREAADKALIVDMLCAALTEPRPRCIVLCSQDADFANALNRLHDMGHVIIVLWRSDLHRALYGAAHVDINIRDVLKGNTVGSSVQVGDLDPILQQIEDQDSNCVSTTTMVNPCGVELTAGALALRENDANWEAADDQADGATHAHCDGNQVDAGGDSDSEQPIAVAGVEAGASICQAEQQADQADILCARILHGHGANAIGNLLVHMLSCGLSGQPNELVRTAVASGRLIRLDGNRVRLAEVGEFTAADAIAALPARFRKWTNAAYFGQFVDRNTRDCALATGLVEQQQNRDGQVSFRICSTCRQGSN